ncbi:MAG TPA: peptidylprolyl isomerase [Candidatus Acidoferrales bacterium]|nr:peptidylprolyl isomerase [Candidatus Acidoferrales bacterium]
MKRSAVIFWTAVFAILLPTAVYATGTIVDEIIARVNNDIITFSDYQKALDALPGEVQQGCQGCAPDKISAMLATEKKDLLRDLIDQSLLVQRAKDLNISVDTDVIKRLDDIRQQNGLDSMDALQKAVEGQGYSWEDYKDSMKNELLRQRVISEQVGSNIKIGHDEVLKYYDAHKNEFVRPEEVDLSVIFLSTENKNPTETLEIKQKAENLLKRLKEGEDFGALAKRFSEGSTAAQGGEIGEFPKDELSPALAKLVFSLHKGDVTDVLPASNGMQIYRVNEHYDAGLQPLAKVEPDVENALYQQRIQPALRKYLDQLRKDSYVVVKAGYVDAGAVEGGSVISEAAYTAEQAKTKKKKVKKTTDDADQDQNP